MPAATPPFSGTFSNTHGFCPLKAGDALMLKAQVATAQALISLAVANGNVLAPTNTVGTTLKQIGPFANDCVIQVSATGDVRVETSVAGISAAV